MPLKKGNKRNAKNLVSKSVAKDVKEFTRILSALSRLSSKASDMVSTPSRRVASLRSVLTKGNYWRLRKTLARISSITSNLIRGMSMVSIECTDSKPMLRKANKFLKGQMQNYRL